MTLPPRIEGGIPSPEATEFTHVLVSIMTHVWVMFRIAVAGSHEKSDSRSRWQNTHNHLSYQSWRLFGLNAICAS